MNIGQFYTQIMQPASSFQYAFQYASFAALLLIATALLLLAFAFLIPRGSRRLSIGVGLGLGLAGVACAGSVPGGPSAGAEHRAFDRLLHDRCAAFVTAARFDNIPQPTPPALPLSLSISRDIAARCYSRGGVSAADLEKAFASLAVFHIIPPGGNWSPGQGGQS